MGELNETARRTHQPVVRQPDQTSLQRTYTERLSTDYGVAFNQLFTLANMPIERFARDLQRQGALDAYMRLLQESFNPAAVDGLMCLNTVSVDWEGNLYDCDFNQMLHMPAGGTGKSIWHMKRLDDLSGADVATDAHCLACTAGAGSSCGGAIA